MITIKKENGPLRMCVSCREHLEKTHFLRIVKSTDGNIIIDIRGNMSGRGAYICKKQECIEKTVKQQKLNRAFKGKVSDDIYAELCSIGVERQWWCNGKT